ncbi:MAG: DinB family protein [Anaerolineae bacterium]
MDANQAFDFAALVPFFYTVGGPPAGFWYAHPLHEVEGLTEEQLYWVPDPHSLCILWQVGHIACRERLHIGSFLQGLGVEELWPEPYGVFGGDWASVAEVRRAVAEPAGLFAWVQEARQRSLDYIRSLTPGDFNRVVSPAADNLTCAHWLMITACHTALHIGRIQALRAMIEGKPERAC